MNVASERAREACESCRRSHKKCEYDNNSTWCIRCGKRNIPCSLFPTVETTAVAQQGAPASVATVDSWDGTHDFAASSSLTYQPPPQENHYWVSAVFTETTQGEYPADMTFQSTANESEGEQPVMNQDDLYDHNNVFQ